MKHEMQDRGFCSRDFASLDTDMNSGSRELLLAAGWLICKEHILDRFMVNCTSPLDVQNTTLGMVSSLFLLDYSHEVEYILFKNYLI